MGKAQRRRQASDTALRPLAPSNRAAVHQQPAGAHVARALLAPMLIAVVVLGLYASSFSIPFLFDDLFEITNNPTVKTVEPLWEYLRRSRGIPSLTFALNYRWGGFDVWGFHLVNVLIHLINGILVYALVLRTLRLPALRDRYRAHAEALAALVALVFVAHPLQTMAASYIVQRAESLAACCYLLTLLLFSVAATTPRPWRVVLYGAAALSAILGVMSKESVASVPLMALAYRYCFLSDRPRPSHLGRLALAALLLLPLAYGVMLARPYLLPAAETAAPDLPRTWMYIPTAGFQVAGITSWQYLLTEFGVILWYLRLAVLPTQQCFDYGWPFVDSPLQANVLLPLVGLTVLAIAAILSYRRYRLATFCLAWFFITLAPTSTIIPLRDAAFEQRMYLPLVGLAWLAVVGAYDLLAHIAARLGRNPRPFWRAGAVVASVWIALIGVATVDRNGVLADPLRLAADSAAKAPQNWRAQYALGDALAQRQRGDDAIAALEEAIRLDPRQGAPRVQLGNLYLQRHRLDDAERVLTPATLLLEESVVAAAYVQLAAAQQARGALDVATLDLREALALKPEWASARRQLAFIYARQGLWFSAAGEYGKVVQSNPQLAAAVSPQAAQASYLAAVAFQQGGKPTASESMLRTALSYRPQWPVAQHYLAYVLAARGAWAEAEQELQRAAAAAPTDGAITENLRRVRARQPLLEPPSETVAGARQ
jgi:protein O-mannosyl-transferase